MDGQSLYQIPQQTTSLYTSVHGTSHQPQINEHIW